MAKKSIERKLPTLDGIPVSKILQAAEELRKQGKVTRAKRLRYVAASMLYQHYAAKQP